MLLLLFLRTDATRLRFRETQYRYPRLRYRYKYIYMCICTKELPVPVSCIPIIEPHSLPKSVNPTFALTALRLSRAAAARQPGIYI